MNGFSLLMVLATVGTTAQVEIDSTGQASYTIRIENVLIDQLRQGQIVDSNVAPADRRIKRFRVLVTEPAGRSGGFQSRIDAAPRSESLVEYEAVPMENGEIEMWVQLSPERLETLAKRPIEGQVPAEVPQIHRFRIFVGVEPLRQQTNATAKEAPPPYLLADTNGLSQAGATSDPSRRSTTAATTPGRANAFPSGSSTYSGGLGNSTTPPPLATTNTRTTDARTNWRNTPDQSTIQPPPTYGQSQVVGQSLNNAGQYNTSTNPRYDDQYNQPTYNNTAPVYNDRTNQYPYGNNTIAQSNIQPAQPTQQVYNQNPYNTNQGYPANQGYGQAQATIAARPDTQQIQPAAPPGNNWIQQAPNGLTATTQPVVQTIAPAAAAVTAPAATTVVKATEESHKTSTPLILTTLALFTSLGVNTYLGWLAWSFFWRYRDAVNDTARARSYNAPGRQAA